MTDNNAIRYHAVRCGAVQCSAVRSALQCSATRRGATQRNAIQYNTASVISNIEQNNNATKLCTQNWVDWKGGGQKNNITI